MATALTTTSREDANAAAAKATIDLLRVADMDDDTKDASVTAVDACGRLARALAVPGARVDGGYGCVLRLVVHISDS